MRQRAEVGEPRFVLAADDADLEIRLLPNARDELIGVRGVAHGARRDRFDAGRTELARQRGHAPDRLGGAFHGWRGELARPIELGAEPGCLLHLVHDGDHAVGGDVGDDLADGVGPDVDRGDAARGGGHGLGR